ncbi:MAG: ATP-dependent DNA helicase DinG [Hahellaceae bacterium]|nr:ATP-dependent DNA helicase DinG [Hahellaceae bacterium]
MLSDDLKKQIQTAYSQLMNLKGYRSRFGQRHMIAEIARYLGQIRTDDEGERTSEHKVCAVEAGTGTGKTLAYSIATIPIAKAMGVKVVISTATTALQDQIVSKDLPDLFKNSGLNFTWALAKGRRRYLCMSKLETRLHTSSGQAGETLPMFMLEATATDKTDPKFYERLLAAYANMKWNGDRDQWAEPIDDQTWQLISTDNQQCTNRRCSYFSSCAFYEQRKGMDTADVIVANHDLVLADLSLGGGVVLPAPKETIYIFDEGHHLADKALSHFAVHTQIKGSQQWLKQLTKALADMLPHFSQGARIRGEIESVGGLTQPLHDGLEVAYQLAEELLDWQVDDNETSATARCREGRVPEAICNQSLDLQQQYSSLVRLLDTLQEELLKGLDEKNDRNIDKPDAETWYPAVGMMLARAQNYMELWRFFATPDPEGKPPSARWAIKRQFDSHWDIELYGSPLLADSLLYNKLWSQCYGAIVTSATLTALGNFQRVAQKSGFPENSQYLQVPSPFRYADAARLILPAMKSDPGDASAHTSELLEIIPEYVHEGKGNLVLFSSRRQMQDVYAKLPDKWRDLILTQDATSKQEVLRQHKAKVDAGETSILFGLASFAEGIDLPGDYLTCVMIAKIPFAVPDDPLEAGLSEWITAKGGNPFMQITVPDASTRLIQACGRLLRTESDSGQVVIFDKRLQTRRYGEMLLNALPPFSRG